MGRNAQSILGLFLCPYNKAVLHPRKMAVMAILSPLKDFCNGKGSTVFYLPPCKKTLFMNTQLLNITIPVSGNQYQQMEQCQQIKDAAIKAILSKDNVAELLEQDDDCRHFVTLYYETDVALKNLINNSNTKIA